MMAVQPQYSPLAFYCVAYGTPAPAGSKRHVGGGRIIETNANVKPWREAVKHAALAVKPATPLDGPLKVEFVFTLRKPASAPKRRRTWPVRKPDVSKLARATEDALTDAGVWRDDAQVVSLLAHKVYAEPEDSRALETPGVVIRVWRVDAEQ